MSAPREVERWNLMLPGYLIAPECDWWPGMFSEDMEMTVSLTEEARTVPAMQQPHN